MSKTTTKSIRTVGNRLSKALEAVYAPFAVSELPAVRTLSEALDNFRAWAERPEVRATLLALREWATVDVRLQEYRQRWESQRVPISVDEAKYELHCLMYAAFNEQVDPVRYLVHKLGEAPSEEELGEYFKRAESKRIYWDALEAYKESLGQEGRGMPSVLLGWPPRGAERPNGGGRPRGWIFRDQDLIPKSIQKLEGCGLPVTSADGPSIAAAVADVFSLTERNVAAIWESAENRCNKRSRQRYFSKPCNMCGRPKVPKWRAARDDFRCVHCAPSFSETVTAKSSDRTPC